MSEHQKKRPRELPEGYKCHACGESDHPIYDCTLYRNRKHSQPKKIRLFMWGLITSTTTESLTSFLTEHEISDPSIKLIMNENGGCKGVGFITVNESEKDKVLALNGESLGARQFNVKIDVKEPQKKVQSKRCYRCGEKHDPTNCTNQRICYRCKGNDHVSSECPLKSSKSTST